MAQGPKPPRVQRDHYARTSYLLQVAAFHMGESNPALARAMARNLRLVARRTVLRLLPYMKRQLCKKCDSLWVPGLTVTVRLESVPLSPKADVLVYSCLGCDAQRRFPIGKDPNYELFCDRAAL